MHAAILAQRFADDKGFVMGFAQRAQELLEAAIAGPAGSEMTVLIGHDGAIQLCADSDWPLESLARERGARSAYRVSSNRGGVRVEGREGLRTCVLESSRPQMLLGPNEKASSFELAYGTNGEDYLRRRRASTPRPNSAPPSRAEVAGSGIGLV